MPEVFVGVGSNIDREHNIRSGLLALAECFGALRLSPVYQSGAVGFEGEDFYNLVVAFETADSIAVLSETLRKIEHRHGRGPSAPKFSSRTLDLDILLYGDACGEVDGVVLPREEVLYNSFVLRPLADLAPQGIHPIANKTFAELWQQLRDQTAQVLTLVEFN